jgi:predicted nucleic acid-binding protein
MNGSSLLIDTNIALYLLNGDQTIADLLDGRNVYFSFISELELLGFQGITEDEKAVIKELLSQCIVIDLNYSIKDITVALKQNYNLKLPDAIIAATSLYLNLPLISADKGFERVPDLHFIKYEL